MDQNELPKDSDEATCVSSFLEKLLADEDGAAPKVRRRPIKPKAPQGKDTHSDNSSPESRDTRTRKGKASPESPLECRHAVLLDNLRALEPGMTWDIAARVSREMSAEYASSPVLHLMYTKPGFGKHLSAAILVSSHNHFTQDTFTLAFPFVVPRKVSGLLALPVMHHALRLEWETATASGRKSYPPWHSEMMELLGKVMDQWWGRDDLFDAFPLFIVGLLSRCDSKPATSRDAVSTYLLNWLKSCLGHPVHVQAFVSGLKVQNEQFGKFLELLGPFGPDSRVPALLARMELTARTWEAVADAECKVGGRAINEVHSLSMHRSSCIGNICFSGDELMEKGMLMLRHTLTLFPHIRTSYDLTFRMRSDVPGPNTQQENRKQVLPEVGGDGTNAVSLKTVFANLISGVRDMRGEDSDTAWHAMQEASPWTVKANMSLARSSAMARRGNTFRMPPLLLVGKPGIGKTRWARMAARTLGLPFYPISFAGANSSVMVSGTERGWSNQRPGVAALAMQQTDCANPVVLVDEVDKAGTSDHNGNAINALLPLLERETSCRFMDTCLLSLLDAGGVSWVLTANSLDRLPSALLDRVTVVEVEAPLVKHIPAIIAGMVEDIRLEMDIRVDWMPEVDNAHVTELTRMYSSGDSLRTLKRRLRAILEEQVWSPPVTALH